MLSVCLVWQKQSGLSEVKVAEEVPYEVKSKDDNITARTASLQITLLFQIPVKSKETRKCDFAVIGFKSLDSAIWQILKCWL